MPLCVPLLVFAPRSHGFCFAYCCIKKFRGPTLRTVNRPVRPAPEPPRSRRLPPETAVTALPRCVCVFFSCVVVFHPRFKLNTDVLISPRPGIFILPLMVHWLCPRRNGSIDELDERNVPIDDVSATTQQATELHSSPDNDLSNSEVYLKLASQYIVDRF